MLKSLRGVITLADIGSTDIDDPDELAFGVACWQERDFDIFLIGRAQLTLEL